MGSLQKVTERPDLSRNLFFDTCAYDSSFLTAALRQHGIQSMAFGTETPGAGSATINPITGRPADDVLATIDAFDFLSNEQKTDLVYTNPLRVFPLLKGRLSVQGVAH
jgi:4-oxalmesaconate hydratase